ncbi:hypothetical protein B0H10DRAFT_2189143 [Mycena sp. CBHHK59/15]|nr:hypothetical protein B0H10DRAFT_2189143 [Mycena sp. CBHHK59/15]
MPPNLVDGGDRFTVISPESLKITAVAINTDIQGSVTCKLSVGKDESEAEVLQSSLPRRALQPPVVIRRGMVLVAHCTHRKQVWKKPEITTRDIAFQDILQQVLPVNPKSSTPVDGSEITLHIDFGYTPHVLAFRFRLTPVDQGSVVRISMAKVNQSISGRGFHYIGLHADGSTMFERRLTRAPYPQEFSLSPMFSFHHEMDLRLCLLRRPYYIWPRKSVVKSSSLTASEAHDLLYAGPPEGVEHTFVGTPEITVRLQWEDPTAVLDQSAKMVSRRTHILDRLGRSRDLMENIVQLVSSASEVHPIAKVVSRALGHVYNNVAKLKDWDDKLLDLIDDMSRCLAYVDDIRPFATIGHFQETLKTLEPMIQRTGNLVLKYPQHGLSFQTEMSEYDTLRRRFERWTRQLSQGLGVESLKRLGIVQELMEGQKEFLNKHRNDIIDRIRPPGTDRERPISGCLQGTRERIFRKIDSWLADSNSPNILWIKGFPGCGKSCIARSLVEKLTDSPRFGSRFFFERDGGVFTAPSTMLRTIASDLCRHPVFMDALVADQETRMMDFSTTSIKDQFIRLVEKPLQCLVNELRDGNTLVVVVDALDECGGLGKSRYRDRQDLLAVIAQWSALSPLLRLVVTSRDETPISEVLNPISTPLELRLSSRQASRDIEVFLKLEFQRIAGTHSLPDSWPTQDEIRALAKKARGLFVWAATLVKFVDQPRPHDILQQILRGNMNVEGDITDLYKLILEISFCQDRPPSSRFLAEFNDFVGGIVTANRPLEKGSPLFNILRVETATTNYICRQLRSVMMESEKHLRFSHQSFVDFLISDTCPLIFRITPSVNMQNISLAILNLLNDRLRFDPSEFRTSYASNPRTRAMNRISGELSYACQFWGDTLVGDNNGDEVILACLKTFLETKFLFWLEVLSLTSQMSCALTQLLYAKSRIGAHDVDLGVFVADAITFVETFQECIGKSAPHVYLSAMTFTPASSRIYQTYSPLLRPCASVNVQTAESLRMGRSAIPAPIIYSPSGTEVAGSFEGHVDDILSVLITHDGCVASASDDTTIRFWDASSGRPILRPFVTHNKSVTSLAVSRDGMLLVSGSRDGTASVWDMKSHNMLTAFAHEGSVTCVTLSPTGTVVVTGCKDKTVKFWNISSQRESRTAFREHTARVTAVAFLEGNIALSGSLDGSVYMHHISGHSEILIRGKIPINSLAVATTTRSLVAGCRSCIAIWDLSDRNVPGDPIYLAENSHEIESVAVNGSRIAAAMGKNIEIWDMLSKKHILGPLAGHKDIVTSVAFSEDGVRLVSGSIDRSIRVWDVGTEVGMSLGGFPDGSKIEPTGWIRGPKRDLIIWVPESHRRRLCWGRTLAVIDGRPAAYLSVSETLLGKRWCQCLI